ncbi:MAG: hypothetical protein PVF05_06195 [Gemmatimonadales bacterium]|jgi:hypothetical protein
MNAPPLSVLHVDLAGPERSAGDGPARLATALDGSPGLRQARLQGEGALSALRALFSGFGADWDVVHAYGERALRLALAVRALAGGRAPVVGALAAGDEAGRLSVWQRADLVLVGSASQREMLVSGGIDRRRVAVADAAGAGPSSVDAVLACYRALARRSP